MRAVAIPGAFALAALATACTEQVAPTAPREQTEAAVPTFNPPGAPEVPARDVPVGNDPAQETAAGADLRLTTPVMTLSVPGVSLVSHRPTRPIDIPEGFDGI